MPSSAVALLPPRGVRLALKKADRRGSMTEQQTIDMDIPGAAADLSGGLPPCMTGEMDADLAPPDNEDLETAAPERPATARQDAGAIELLGTMLRGLNAIGSDLAYLAKCAGDGTSQAQSIAQASERLFVTVFEIQQSASEASSDAEAADESAANGLASVKNAIAAMQRISVVVEETSRKLDDLARASSRIDEIVSLTANIASQTKLLALNATIEAVRAGDAGKSFAVVAAEVKRLAEQSAKASVEIKTDLAALTGGMSLIISTMAETTGAVAEGEKAITDAGSTMEAMSQQVSNAARKMKDITKAVEDEGSITSELAQLVDKITATTTAGGEKLRSAAQKMRAGNNWFYGCAERLESFDTPGEACEALKLDHLMLARQITDVLLGTGDLKPQDVADACECRLEEWLAESGIAEYADPELLAEIQELHGQTHALASETLQPETTPDACVAMEKFSRFTEANNRLCRLLAGLGQQS